ncbi:MAG: hypothetical protein AAF586_09440 [Planctomycetota bacterium]
MSDAEPSMVLDFHTSIDDVAQVTYHQLRDMGTDKAYRNNMLKTATFIAIFAGVLVFLDHRSVESLILPLVLGGCVIWLVILAMRSKSKLIEQARRNALQTLGSDEWREFRLILDAKGAMAEMPTHDIRYHWPAFLRREQSETHLLIFFKQGGLIGIPLRVFQARYDMQTTLATIDRLVAECGSDATPITPARAQP